MENEMSEIDTQQAAMEAALDAAERAEAEALEIDPATEAQAVERGTTEGADPDVDPAELAAAGMPGGPDTGLVPGFRTPGRRGFDSLHHRLALKDIAARPEWHAVAEPDRLARAWSAVLEAVEAAREVGEEAVTVSQRRAAEQGQHLARVRQAAAAGEAPPKSDRGTDWAAEAGRTAASSLPAAGV
jgi:hypothetical protein